MKYRNKNKIKVKHSLINGLLPFLERVAEWPEVKAINPGEIKPRGRRQGSPLIVTVQYITKTGLKGIARSQGVQEFFVVTSEPEKVKERIEKGEGGLNFEK